MRWIVFALAVLSAAQAAWAVPAYKGMSYTSFGATTLSGAGSDQSLMNMSLLGTDTVALNFWWFQPDVFSSNIAASSSSATIASIEHAIDHIHSLGMKVFLKPMLDVSDGTWRAHIEPNDPDQWFTNYRNYVNTFADIAEAKGVELFSIGCEFNKLENSTNNQRWIDTIADVRTHYSGPLTYSANWSDGGFGGGYNTIQWWDQLDKVGIDAYFPVSTTTNPTQAQLNAGWNTVANDLEIWRNANQPTKQVIFTEVGYSSYDGTAITPYDLASNHPGAGADEVEQAAAYEALLSVMSQREWWDGAFWWNWETNPTPTSATSFTPQFKLAQEVITNHYGGAGAPNPFSQWSNNAGGQFGTAGNWSGGVPNAVYHVEFDPGDGVAYTVSINNSNRTVQRLWVHSGTVTFDSSSATQRTLTADDWHMDDSNRGIIIGVDAGDAAIVNAGSALASLSARGIVIGDAAGASGTLNLLNAANRLNVTGTDSTKIELIVGRAGNGTLNVANGADVTVTATGGNVTVGRDVGSVGTVIVSGSGSTFATSGILRIGLDGQALLNVSNGAQASGSLVVAGLAGKISGDGTIAASVTNLGAIHPGNSPGTLRITGNYSQSATGLLVIELASNSSFDTLQITGSATFAGTLRVELFEGFAPLAGDSFDLLNFASRSGSFATIDLPMLDENLAWDTSLLYTTGVLSVIATNLPGDFNGDHIVDAADYTVWRNGLGSTYIPEDYDVWKTNFGRSNGAGAAGKSTSVPEPASVALLIVGIAIACCRCPAFRSENAK